MIEETEPELKVHALKNLAKLVDHSWHEIADCLSRIEELAEDQQFVERALACQVASKVYYYLENFEKALMLALDSEGKFDLDERSQYVEKLINECVDHYKKVQLASLEAKKRGEPGNDVDPKLAAVIDRMFDRCFKDKKFKHVIGIALECRRLDKVREAIELSGAEMEANLAYCFRIAQ
jgi:26S proteasome regulatory subunit N2